MRSVFTEILVLKECEELKGKQDGAGLLGFRKDASQAQLLAEGTKFSTKIQGIINGRGESDISSLEVTRNDCSYLRNVYQKNGGGCGNVEGLTEAQSLSKLQAFSMHQRHDTGNFSRNVVSCPSGSTLPLGAVPFLQEKSLLLPTPQAPADPLPPKELNTCSVIQPPRHRDRPEKSSEQNPIMPQLFPASRGAPFGHTYREVLGGKCDLSDGCSFSSIDTAPRESELGPFHISQLFPPCSSSQLFSSTSDSLCYNSWHLDYWSEQEASAQKFGASLPPVQPTHLTGNFIPSSTTLFSSTFGENHQISRGAAFTSSSYDPLPLLSSQTLNPPLASASESNVGLLPTFVRQAWSCTRDDDFGEEKQGSEKNSSWMPSSALCFPVEMQENLTANKPHQPSNSPAEVVLKENIGRLTSVNQDFQHLSQVLLQHATFSDAAIDDSCCVCFDRSMDVSLISCGHQLCKGCKEEMHRLHRLCPVCNQMIETVLSLCA